MELFLYIFQSGFPEIKKKKKKDHNLDLAQKTRGEKKKLDKCITTKPTMEKSNPRDCCNEKLFNDWDVICFYCEKNMRRFEASGNRE